MDDIHTKHGHPEDENPAVSYERGDIDIFAVTKFGIGLAIATIVVVFLMWGLFDWFHKHTHEEVEQLPQSVIDGRSCASGCSVGSVAFAARRIAAIPQSGSAAIEFLRLGRSQ